MKKTKVLSVVLTLILSIGLLSSCGKKPVNDTPAPANGTTTSGAFKDGIYKAIYDRNDVRNWKAFVEITVKDGKVAEAKYDYTNDKGEMRTDNKGYSDAFKAANGYTPKEGFTKLGERLVAAQDAEKVDTLTGATHSTKNFKQLAAAALESAKKGDTAEAVIPLYQDGVYKVAFDNFDAHGWKGQIELEIKDHKISNITFDYVNKDGKLKTQDEGYKAAMEKSGTYPGKFIPELQQSLLDKQIISTVDAVAGATASSNDFKALVEFALDDMAEKGNTSPMTMPLPKGE